MRSPVMVADKFAQLYAGGRREIERSAVDEANANPAVSRGFNDIARENRIVDARLNGHAVCTRDGTGTGYRLDFADDFGGSDNVLSTAFGRANRVPGQIAVATEHGAQSLLCPNLALSEGLAPSIPDLPAPIQKNITLEPA